MPTKRSRGLWLHSHSWAHSVHKSRLIAAAQQFWAVRFFLDREGRIRDRALFDLAIDSKLRGCDLVKIRIRDLVAGLEIRTRAIVVQQKTGRPVQFEITSDVRASLLAWLEGVEARSTTMHSQAGSITPTT